MNLRRLIIPMLLMLLMVGAQACKESSLYPPTGNDDQDQTRLYMTDVEGVEWQLKSFEVVGGEVTAIPSEQLYTITFSGGELSGVADCNNYGGAYTTAKDFAITIKGLNSTKVYCGDQSFDSEFRNALEGAATYDARSSTLKLYYENGTKRLNLEKRSSPMPRNLTLQEILGIEWKLEAFATTVQNQVKLKDVPDDQLYTIIFNKNNGVGGTIDCNNYIGNYTSKDGKSDLSISGAIVTLAYCGDQSLDQEYLLGLRETHSFVATENELRLFYNGDNSPTLIFSKKGTVHQNGLPLDQTFGMEWELESFEVINGTMKAVPTGQMYTIGFTGDGFSGQVDCNNYGGLYTSDNVSTLALYDIYATEAECGPMSVDGEYMAALENADAFETDGQYLKIFYENSTKVLNFKVRQPSDPVIEDIQLVPFPLILVTSDPYKLLSANIKGDFLEIEVEYSGGCRVHSFQLLGDSEFTKDDPTKINVFLIHEDNDDPCDALQRETLRYNLTPVKEEYGKLLGAPIPVGTIEMTIMTMDGSDQKLVIPYTFP